MEVLNGLMAAYDPALLAGAGAVCVFGCYTAFSLVERSTHAARRWRASWLALAGLASGATTWATHFVSMLADHTHAGVDYAIAPTIGSIVVAVGGGVLGFLTARTMDARIAPVVGGATLGGGIAAMHFAGMAAMRGAIPIHDASGVAAAVIAGTLLSAVSVATFREDDRPRRIAAALLLTSAVAVVHFGSMTAMSMPEAAMHHTASAGAIRHSWIGGAIGVTIALLLALGTLCERFSAALVRRNRLEADRMRILSDMSLEGIMIISESGRVEDLNRCMSDLIGDVAGAPLDTVLPAIAARIRAGTTDRSAIDATLRSLDGRDVPTEVFIHRAEHLRRAGWAVIVRDVSERVEAERLIQHMANHDALTGLPNRALLMDRLERELTRNQRTGGQCAVLYIDLDGFKAVNDIYGHSKGDEILRRTADIMRSAVRSSDTLARLGGDEFIVVQTDAEQPGTAERLAARLIEAMDDAYGSGHSEVTLGMSIGISIATPRDMEPEAVLRQADVALYRAKESGRGTWRFFEDAMDDRLRDQRSLEIELRRSLDAGTVWLSYQPQMDADTGRIDGFEALVRWNHPTRGPVTPDIFIPLAERSGFIVPLGMWILRSACAEAASWPNPLRIAVNLSPIQIHQGGLVARVRRVLEETGLDPDRLELEITETSLLRNRDAAIAVLQGLKALGVRIAMDDFGTGCSSLANLRSFPFDKIKIDRSFVDAIDSDDRGAKIVRAILGLGHSLELPIIAEGVENQGQLDVLKDEGCGQIQGYLIGRPQTIDAFDAITGRTPRAVVHRPEFDEAA